MECRRFGYDPWIGKIPARRKWQPTPVFLPGKIPWTEEPSELQSRGSQRVGHDWAINTTLNIFYNRVLYTNLNIFLCLPYFYVFSFLVTIVSLLGPVNTGYFISFYNMVSNSSCHLCFHFMQLLFSDMMHSF